MSPTEQPAAFFRLRGGGHKIATGSRRGEGLESCVSE
jgi:hypothetical protein